jgi:hypothetical protein
VDVTPTIGDSEYTSRTVRPEASFSYLDFYVNELEPSQPNGINLVHAVQSADDASCNVELLVYKAPYVGVDMHMTVSKSSLKPLDTFRVLIMSYYTHFNSDVAEHIKMALQAASQGDTTLKQPSLVMHHCAGGAYGSDRREIILHVDRPGPSAVNIRGGKAWSGMEAYPLWDLAIFLHTSLANVPAYEMLQLENTFEKARLAMRSANVPIMDLSTHHPLYKAVPHLYTCGRKSLHLRVSTKENKDAQEVPCEMLPIDLDKFFAIDPRTLGRHLACITEPEFTSARTTRKRKRSVVYESAFDAYVAAKKFAQPAVTRAREHLRFFEGLELIDIILGLLVALTAVLFCSYIPGYLAGAQIKLTDRIPPVPAPTPIPQVNPWADLLAQKFSVLSENPSAEVMPKVSSKVIQPTSGSTLHKAQNTFAANAKSSKSGNQSKKDEAIKKEQELLRQAYKQWSWERTGSHTYTLTPPVSLAQFTKDKIQISALWYGKKIATKIESLSKQAWNLHVDPHLDCGEAKFVVQGHYQLEHMGKVPFTYEFLVDLDHENSKSPFETVKDMVAQEFILVQTNAMELSTRMTTGLQQYVDSLQQRALALREQALKGVDDTRKALLNLSPSDIPTAEWKSKRQQLRQLKKTKKALRKQGKCIASQIEATVRAAQDMVEQQYRDAVDGFRAIPQWQRNTAWPVRAGDWAPTTALKRGWGNAQGLLRKLRGGPKLIDAPPQPHPGCTGHVHRRKVSSHGGRRGCRRD